MLRKFYPSPVPIDRTVKIAILSLNGTNMHGATSGIVAWKNEEGSAIILIDAVLDVTTIATGAATVDVGTTATSAATTSDNIFDGIDANGAISTNIMRDASLDSAANIGAKRLASGKWITVDEKTGDTTGMVAKLYIFYVVE